MNLILMFLESEKDLFCKSKWSTKPKTDVLGIDARGNKYFTKFRVGYGAYGNIDPKIAFTAAALKPKDLQKSEDEALQEFF